MCVIVKYIVKSIGVVENKLLENATYSTVNAVHLFLSATYNVHIIVKVFKVDFLNAECSNIPNSLHSQSSN